jgi:hypothetical protein
MSIVGTQPYEINNELNIAEVLAHFDSNYIFDILEDKLNSISFSVSQIESNIIESFETNFKKMNDDFPGDSANIREVRQKVYEDIIKILTNKFNLKFNEDDTTIDLYTAAYYLYDFLISHRNSIMINFFTAFIINNKDSLCKALGIEDGRKNKDSASAYGKRIYQDNKYILLSANMAKVINYISNLDVTLSNIFSSTYKDQSIILFLDNAYADKGNFFKDFYCNIIHKPEELPIIITNIRLALQNSVGNISQANIEEFLSFGGELNGSNN